MIEPTTTVEPMAADRFGEVVTRFCAWVEDVRARPEEDESIARRLLAELYSLALSLPEGRPDPAVDAPRIDDVAWKRVYARFKSLPVGYYGIVADPAAMPPEEPVVGDACDDLADIYRDLRAGLDLYQRGLVENAVWEWRFHFETHWGAHVLGCLQALHAHDSSVQAGGAP